MTPLHIVHYLDHFRFDAGGVCRAVMDICSLLAARGHQVTLISQDDTDVPAAWRSGGPGLPRAVRLARPHRADAARLLQGADALHLHGMWTTTNIPFASAARRLGVPYIFSPHGMLDDWCMAQRTLKKRLYLWLAGGSLLRHARTVLFAAQAELEQSRQWLGGARAAVVPLVLDLSPFRAPGPPPQRTGRVLFLGRLHPIKRLDLLLDAFTEARRSCPGATLTIAGTGDPDYEDALRGRVQRDALAPAVHFPGMIVGAAKVALLAGADCLVLPSAHENFGFVAFEALAAGTPVVTTRNVCTWPELRDSGGGLIADDAAAPLASAIQQLVNDPARRDRMGAAGRDWALRFFDPDTVGERYEAVYRAQPA